MKCEMSSSDSDDVDAVETFTSLNPGAVACSAQNGRPGRRHPPPGRVCCIYVTVLILFIVAGCILVSVAPGTQTCEDATFEGVSVRPPVSNWTDEAGTQNATKPTLKMTTSYLVLANSMGQGRMTTMQSSTLVLVSALSAYLTTVTAAYVVTCKPHSATPDFEERGTLSNTCQDIALPRGRMFAVMLFTAAIISLFSMYTLHIYPSWFPLSDEMTHFSNAFMPRQEKLWKIMWATLPNIALLYTALLPSLSHAVGTNQALIAVHNVAAPLGMAFALIMEMHQLKYGENAFAYFWCGDEYAGWDGPLTPLQRARVYCLCVTWFTCLSFLGIQIYLGVGSTFGVRIKSSYSLALTSFYLETTTLVLAYCLPAIQSLGVLCFMFKKPVLEEAAEVEWLFAHT